MTEQQEQASFEGWAKVEVMGRQEHVGYVKTEVYGQAVMFRVDTPSLPEREFELKRPEWIGQHHAPTGTKVQRPAFEGGTVLIGSGSIYRITPCTEEAVRKLIEMNSGSRLKLVDVPEAMKALPSPDDEDEEDDDPYGDSPI